MSDFNSNPDWQKFLREIASKVDEFLTSTKNRKRFRQQIQLVVNGCAEWRQAVLDAITAAQHDKSLCASKENLHHNPPPLKEGYQWLDLNFDDLPTMIEWEKVPAPYIQTKSLPKNPLDVLVPRNFLSCLLPDSDEVAERRPDSPAEHLMTDYLLLAVIQANKGNGPPIVAKGDGWLEEYTTPETAQVENLASEQVWFCYESMGQRQKYYLETRFKCKITSALENVKADLDKLKHEDTSTSEDSQTEADTKHDTKWPVQEIHRRIDKLLPCPAFNSTAWLEDIASFIDWLVKDDRWRREIERRANAVYDRILASKIRGRDITRCMANDLAANFYRELTTNLYSPVRNHEPLSEFGLWDNLKELETEIEGEHYRNLVICYYEFHPERAKTLWHPPIEETQKGESNQRAYHYEPWRVLLTHENEAVAKGAHKRLESALQTLRCLVQQQEVETKTESSIKAAPKKKGRPTKAEMGNRNKAVAMAATKFKADYERLPTVDEIVAETSYSRNQIYATNAYKEGKIAKSSSKLTAESTGSSVIPSEQFGVKSLEQSRTKRRSKSNQDELDALIDQQKRDDTSDFTT